MAVFPHSFRKLCSLQEHGGQLEAIWKKLHGEEFRETEMHLESPIKELGIILEAGRKWEKQTCSAESVL